ncbi:sensor histidine kinase [Streptomyces sp. NBC_00083]|uniref:sensor histidine kinase n=1 Tax=Streptomyces sp. NBC_00083 TaxID=2975647 RepID=UPI00224CBBA1|nr:histidine kinase [Streptomyces sp. NBC_00083]MCX5388139.1 histidine kinase [Streptomyces sp. NBC_00083]
MSTTVHGDGPWWDRLFFAPRTTVSRWTGNLVLAGVGLADCWTELARGPWWRQAAVLVATSALWSRRRRPVVAFVLTTPALLTAHALALSALALCALARRRPPHGVTLAATATVAVGDLLCWRPCRVWEGVALTGVGPLDVAQHMTYAVLISSAPAVVGLHYRARVELARHLGELTALRRQERHLHAQRAVGEERARIGREMHDVVSHKAGLIAVQAGALSVTAADPETRRTAETLRQLAVATLEELRTILLVLRGDGPHARAQAPAPEIADLAPLVARSGVDARLHVSPAVTARSLPGTYRRTVYRTAQEGLTNVRKHAPGTTASVSVTLSADGTLLLTTVHNTPPPTPAQQAPPVPGSGHGFIGLRERAALSGGTLTAGPSPDGGFAVALSLPLRPG